MVLLNLLNMRRKRTTIRHRIEYLIFSTIIFTVKITPLFLQKIETRFFHFLLKITTRRQSKVISRNLMIAFPQKNPAERKNFKKQIYRHFSVMIVEILNLFAKKKPDGILKTIEVKNAQAITKALDRKKGLVVFSAHFGNWELVPFVLDKIFPGKICSIARKMDNPLVEKLVLKFRQYMGSQIIYKENSIRRILLNLNQNKIIYLLIDQNTHPKESVLVDFFRKKTGVVTSVSQLGIKRDIPIIPLFLHYEKEKIILDILEELKIKKTGNTQDDILLLTQQCTSLIEQKIMEHPTQWFWFHNRWKTKPDKRRNP